jgi:hypothetical protein
MVIKGVERVAALDSPNPTKVSKRVQVKSRKSESMSSSLSCSKVGRFLLRNSGTVFSLRHFVEYWGQIGIPVSIRAWANNDDTHRGAAGNPVTIEQYTDSNVQRSHDPSGQPRRADKFSRSIPT